MKYKDLKYKNFMFITQYNFLVNYVEKIEDVWEEDSKEKTYI